MSQVISPQSGAPTVSIRHPARQTGHAIRLFLSAWWRAWSAIAPDLGRGGIR